MREKKTAAVNTRVEPRLKERLDHITERFGVSITTQVEDALSALADYVERIGKYERPMRMESAGLHIVEISAVAEVPGTYGVPAPEHVQNPKQPGRGAGAKRA